MVTHHHMNTEPALKVIEGTKPKPKRKQSLKSLRRHVDIMLTGIQGLGPQERMLLAAYFDTLADVLRNRPDIGHEEFYEARLSIYGMPIRVK